MVPPNMQIKDRAGGPAGGRGVDCGGTGTAGQGWKEGGSFVTCVVHQFAGVVPRSVGRRGGGRERARYEQMCYSYTFLSLSLSLFHYFILFLPSLRSSHAFYNNERKGFASSSSSVLRSKLQHRRRRSITSGVDRSERRRQRGREGGRVQNPLGNQSSTALQSLRQSLRRTLVAAANDEQELVKKRKGIRTRFDAAAAAEAATRKWNGKTRIPYFHSINR